MSSLEIKDQIKINDELCKKIEEIISTIEIPDANQKAMLFAAFLQNSLSHFCAINILIEKRLFNSAFALIRVFFESILRGQYMAYIYDNTIVNTIYTNRKKWKFPAPEKMCKDLDRLFEVDMFDKIKTQSYGMMNDYTHTGHNQIARHFSEEKCTIEPDFDAALIIDTLKGNYTLMNFFAKKFIAFMKDIEILNKNLVYDEF